MQTITINDLRALPAATYRLYQAASLDAALKALAVQRPGFQPSTCWNFRDLFYFSLDQERKVKFVECEK